MHETHSILQHSSEGLHYHSSTIQFRISGLTPYNLDRMRVTLKASSSTGTNDVFHIDTLDLYNSRSRETFAEQCGKYLKLSETVVVKELMSLISVLEQERVRIREQGNQCSTPAMSDQEKKMALGVLKSKDLLQNIVHDFEALGFVGETHNTLLGYISAVSRLLPDPLALLILSLSGAGKTSLQNAICKFIPPESVIQYTRLTGKSLFYREENALKHKVLAIEEEEGMAEAMYSIKTLISSQKLSVAATRADAKTGKLSVDEYTVHGPVVVIVSTTNPDSLTDEEKRRFLILTIDESIDQTRNILSLQRQKSRHSWYKQSMAEENVTRLHHTMQRLLKPLTVTFPDNLNITYPHTLLRMRGEQAKFISLIKAITLLHQYQRRQGVEKRLDGTEFAYVQSTQEDVNLARELGKLIFPRSVDDVSPTGRTLLAHIDAYIETRYEQLQQEHPGEEVEVCMIPFTRKELRVFAGWSEKQVRQNIEPLVELGYLGRVSGRHGATYRYVLIDNGKNDPQIQI